MTALFLLVWAATAGDAFWLARAALLAPDVSMGLARALGLGEQAVFARALGRTQLGLDIVNVTVTTNKPVAVPRNT